MMKTITLAVLLASSTALAQPTDAKAKAKAASDEAQQLYEAKDYAKAADKFNYAYTLDPDPTYHFNAAQAYRQGGDCANAKVFYQKFKDESGKDMSPQDLQKINKYIAGEGCTDRPQTNPTPPNPPPPNPPNPNPPNPNPPNPNANANPIEPNPNPAQPSETPHKSNALAYGLGAAGVAGIVVGIIFTSKVSADTEHKNDVLAMAAMAGCDTQDKFVCPMGVDPTPFNQALNPINNEGSKHQTIAIIGYAAGGAALAGAVVLYMMNRGSSSSNEHAVIITPTPDGVAAAATFRF
jgi:hypothetical protein